MQGCLENPEPSLTPLMNETIATGNPAREAFDRLLGELRPKLHRYCARMAGSVIDGEDIVQEAIVKAIEAFPEAGSITNAEGWLIRIAHNAALDFLRRRTRQEALRSDEDLEMIVDPISTANDRLTIGDLEKLISPPIGNGSEVNASESKREQSEIIRRQFRGIQRVVAIFRGPL